jgi:DinB superfamily
MTTTPPAPEPDTKDWTWAMRAPCPDCGYDPAAVERADVPALTRRYTGVIRDALAGAGAAERPRPDVWAPLEYACHVRDVCTLFRHRLQRMLSEDDPLFDNWDQDETAIEQRYWAQDPEQVAAGLSRAAAEAADAFAAVEGDQWQRPGRRSDGSLFVVDTFARYFLHDLAHHCWDVTGEPGAQ